MRALFLCALATLGLGIGLACEPDKASDDSNDGGDGGTGGQMEAGGEGAGAAIGGREGLSECADSTTTRQVVLVSIDIPGSGRVWPDPPEEWTEGQGGSNGGGAGGAGGATGDSGCSWEAHGTNGSWTVDCAGVAQTSQQGSSECAATFDDGSVVVFKLPPGVVADDEELEFEVDAKSDRPLPFSQSTQTTTLRSLEKSGILRFVTSNGEVDAVARDLFEVDFVSEASCTTKTAVCNDEITTTYFDHVVQTTPRQGVDAREEVEVALEGRTYAIHWIETETQSRYDGEQCPDYVEPSPPALFEAVLVAR